MVYKTGAVGGRVDNPVGRGVGALVGALVGHGTGAIVYCPMADEANRNKVM